ncbi:hypothetical protein AB0G35_24170 [Streptomyces sp. NPDC021749]|uniref:hypothetical protein n=1 Tax=Streptomyces sp. NPDC021749 TaxID=3154905 RepID=UPI0033D7C22A
MSKADFLTFPQIIATHGELVSTVIDRDASTDPVGFVNDVQAAIDVLRTLRDYDVEVYELTSAHLYLTDALHAVGAGQANLLRRVDYRFRVLDRDERRSLKRRFTSKPAQIKEA